MDTRLRLMLGFFLLVSLSLWMAEAQADNEQGEKDPYIGRYEVTVVIGGVKHLLLFENQDISTEIRIIIANDIERAFTGVGEAEIKEFQDDKPSLFGEKYRVVIYALAPSGGRPWWPEVLKTHCRRGLKLGNTHYLIIPEKVSQAYLDALALKGEFPEAYARVDEFLTLINDKEARWQAAETVEDARKLFYFHKVMPEETYEKHVEALALSPDVFMRVEPPSLLDFYKSEELDGSIVFNAPLLYKEGEDAKEHIVKYPFVYSGGRWRFLVAPMP